MSAAGPSTTSSGCPVTRIHLSGHTRVRVAEDPYTAVLALACAGMRAHQHGRSTPAARLVNQLSPEQRRALARLVAPGSSVAPDFLSPPCPEMSTDTAEELVRLRDLSVADVQDDLGRTFADRIPPHWRPVSTRPRVWIAEVTSALERLWTSVEPVWLRERKLRDAEAERVGTALTRPGRRRAAGGAA